ncbi:polyprenyl synthetase family protein [Jeotgalibacillus sp. S-D1]|uniref:polyprenyl synthetase family protein n=1 Tax=Jeotgalibacillus sp. S-D1 TaxID=2552189 RepID=UPI0010592913|nr:farnesyl diphosphate synthase [Jeotgalibacillus sp. S-D1]TDL34631.1 polyprenyl synthetase family protein [Jeotgalibacillus sp. S-D1]
MTLLKTFIDTYKEQIENTMYEEIENLNAPISLIKAMEYSLRAGGKRIRPILVLATMEAFGRNCQNGLKVAAGLEMIHTYSLIHDDLPSMDDDDLRRGKPTNHKVFGEAQAILAGDALLTHSFYLIATSELTAEQRVNLITELSLSAGAEGMVGGQVADIEGEDMVLTPQELESIHQRKTGRLLEFSVLAGGIMSGADDIQQAKLKEYAKHIGLAFQIRDDILDVEGEEEEIGKPVGSDESRNKSTYPALLGMEGAKQKLSSHLTFAKDALQDLPLQNDYLTLIADMIVQRRS